MLKIQLCVPSACKGSFHIRWALASFACDLTYGISFTEAYWCRDVIPKHGHSSEALLTSLHCHSFKVKAIAPTIVHIKVILKILLGFCPCGPCETLKCKYLDRESIMRMYSKHRCTVLKQADPLCSACCLMLFQLISTKPHKQLLVFNQEESSTVDWNGRRRHRKSIHVSSAKRARA